MKEKILLKATDLFLNLGFKSVTMDDLATEMGMSKKTIYTHFPTKTKLVQASTLHLFKEINFGINEIRERRENPIEELFEIKQFTMKHLKGEKSSPQYQLQKYYPGIYATLRSKQLEIMEDCIVKNLQTGVDTGLYRAEIPINFIARIYFSGATSTKDQDLFPETSFTKQQINFYYLEYHLRAICTPIGLTILETLIDENTI